MRSTCRLLGIHGEALTGAHMALVEASMNTGQPLGAERLHSLIGWRPAMRVEGLGAPGRHQRRSIVSGTADMAGTTSSTNQGAAMVTTKDVERLMKRCQVGVGGRNALDEAHDIMAECYGTLGALVQERDRLRKIIDNHMAINDALDTSYVRLAEDME